MENELPAFSRPGADKRARTRQVQAFLRVVLFPLWTFPGIVALAFLALFLVQCVVYMQGHRHVPDVEVLLFPLGLGLVSLTMYALTGLITGRGTGLGGVLLRLLSVVRRLG